MQQRHTPVVRLRSKYDQCISSFGLTLDLFRKSSGPIKIWVWPLTFAAAWVRLRIAANSIVEFRIATDEDCRLLAELNHQLIRDEGHRNRMTVPKLNSE